MSFFGEVPAYPVRTYDEERRFLDQVTDCKWRIRPGFVPNMRVPGTFYVNAALQELVFSELEQFAKSNARQGFLPALKQIANVAGLPGIAVPAGLDRQGLPLGLQRRPCLNAGPTIQ